MIARTKHILLPLLAVGGISSAFANIAVNSSDVSVFVGGEGGNASYRIPSMVVAANGDIVAFAEGRQRSGDPGRGHPISMVAKISSDNGKNWGALKVLDARSDLAFSDPRPLVDKQTGRIFLFYAQWDKNCAQNSNCVDFGDPRHGLIYRYSDNNGQTWSEAVNILNSVRDVNWYANGNGAKNSRATWTVYPSNADIQRANSQGWSLNWQARVADGQCNVQYFADGQKRTLVDLSVNSDKKVLATVNQNGSSRSYDLGFDISGYHNYSLEHSGDQTRFYVDDKLIASGNLATTHHDKRVTFGNGCSNDKGSIAYKKVSFSVGGQILHEFDAADIQADSAGNISGHPGDQGWTRTSNTGGMGDPGWKSMNPGPGQGIQLSSGRLIFPAIVLDAFSQLSVVSVYSDDSGQTWQTGKQTPTFEFEPSEADMVQLSDGRLLLSARNDGKIGADSFNRFQFISSDDGVSWTMIKESRNSINGQLFFKLDQVDIGLLRYGNNKLLMSGPQGNNAVSSDRNDLAIWSATDNGSGVYNFTQRTQLREGYSGYSDIHLLDKSNPSDSDQLGVLYEAEPNTRIKFMVVDMDNIQK